MECSPKRGCWVRGAWVGSVDGGCRGASAVRVARAERFVRGAGGAWSSPSLGSLLSVQVREGERKTAGLLFLLDCCRDAIMRNQSCIAMYYSETDDSHFFS